MARRFVTYNTEDAEKLGIDQRGVLQPGAGDDSGNGSDSFIRKVTEMTPGYVNVKTGAFATGGNWQRTDYIPVSSGDVVTFSGRFGDNMGVAGYDENKVFVTSVLDRIDEGSGYTYENEPLIIPDGVKYIAGCTISGAYPITVMVYSDMQAFADAMSGDWLPTITADDNGKFLGIVDGAVGLVDIPSGGDDNTVTYYAVGNGKQHDLYHDVEMLTPVTCADIDALNLPETRILIHRVEYDGMDPVLTDEYSYVTALSKIKYNGVYYWQLVTCISPPMSSYSGEEIPSTTQLLYTDEAFTTILNNS